MDDLRRLFAEACHGAGAEPRLAARQRIRDLAEREGMIEGQYLREHGFDLAAYFASRPIT